MRRPPRAVFPLLALMIAATSPGRLHAQVPAVEETSRPKLWAVLVGVQKYEKAIPACPGALGDMNALADWLRDTAGWTNAHVFRLADGGRARIGEAPDSQVILKSTRENLDKVMTDWLDRKVGPGDVVVFYFAGQAAVTPDGQEVLLPIDADPNDLGRTGWSPESALDELAARKQCQVVCLLDTSVHGRGRDVGVGGKADAESGRRLLDRLTRWPGTTAWIAADGRPSIDGDKANRGPFVSALLRSLNGSNGPDTLLSNLAAVQADPAMKAQGFRSRGGVPPWLSLGRTDLHARARYEPALLLQRGHSSEVNALALTADGDRMITASQDSTVRLWNVSGGQRVLLKVMSDFTVGVKAMALSPNGRYIAAADGDGLVRVWDLVAARAVIVPGASPHRSRVVQLAFAPSGSAFFTRDQDGRCIRWRVPTTGRSLEHDVLIDSGSKAFALSPDPGSTHPFVAVLNDTGAIGLFPRKGPAEDFERIDGTGKPVKALAVSADGLLALGGRDGVTVRDLTRPDRPIVAKIAGIGAPVSALRFGIAGRLAIAAAERVLLADPRAGGDATTIGDFDHAVTSLATSNDGRWLAVTTLGAVGAWDVADPAKPQPLRLPVSDRSPAGPTCLAFSADGLHLVAGEADGGVRSWDLPGAKEGLRVRPGQGRVKRLDVSPGGRYLLQVDASGPGDSDGDARLWDLEEGRSPQPLAGHWKDGAFLPPGGKQLAMLQAPNHGGSLVLLDRDSGSPVPGVTFAPPTAEGGGKSAIDFTRIAVSRDGHWIAAASASGRDEIVCVWPATGGPPAFRWSHPRTINDLDFSADSRTVLTVADDGAARLWSLDGGASSDPVVIRAKSRPEEVDPPVLTAGRLDPSGRPRMLVASWSPQFASGEVYLVTWDPAAAGRPARWLPLAPLDGRVHAVEFTRDGNRAMAAGNSRSLLAWNLPTDATRSGPTEISLDSRRARPHHTEQVNALASWPDRPQIASGSDDATTRFWRLDAPAAGKALASTPTGTLLGSIVASSSGVGDEWLAFTPSGDFDGSRDGDRLVSFVVDQDVRPLEQFADRFYQFGLTDLFRKGQSPPPKVLPDLPALAIDAPPKPETDVREARLRISLADARGLDLERLRLYQNGVPVKAGPADFALRDRGRTKVAEATVLLRSGPNRFYAMAGQADGIDARSGEVRVEFTGAERPGKTHVVALGVSKYGGDSALKFAHKDAESLGQYLHAHGIAPAGGGPSQAPGELVVLKDGDVNEASVEDALSRVRVAAQGRPEDTVVVFLAGHTDILADRGGTPRFCLLLPNFEFPKNRQIVVGMRGLQPEVSPKAPPDDTYIPYSHIYRNLAHIDAQQRLVIVDACQAEAILDDQAVRRVREQLEKDTRKTRNAYYFAARAGEPAGEDPVLEHGLLTYVLLWGLGSPDLKPPQGDDRAWRGNEPDADRDGNRVITTEELRSFVDRHLPSLNARLPELALRAGRSLPDRPSRGRLRLQAAQATFPLVALPR